MKKPTQTQRQSYRARLIKLGVPEVYAHMAAENIDVGRYVEGYSAREMLWGGFYWRNAPEGYDFWSLIYREAYDL